MKRLQHCSPFFGMPPTGTILVAPVHGQDPYLVSIGKFPDLPLEVPQAHIIQTVIRPTLVWPFIKLCLIGFIHFFSARRAGRFFYRIQKTDGAMAAGFAGFHQAKSASTTASAAQVRQPVQQKSVQKWRQIADELQPVQARLFGAGLIDAEGKPV